MPGCFVVAFTIKPQYPMFIGGAITGCGIGDGGVLLGRERGQG